LNLTRLAYFISALLHPLLLPTFFFALVIKIAPSIMGNVNSKNAGGILLLIFIITFLIPIISILKMDRRQDRKMPFVFVSSFYILSCYLYMDKFANVPLLMVGLISTTVSLVIVTIVTFFWKISAHSVGIGGVLGFLFALSFKYAERDLLFVSLMVLILAGILMSARLYLNAHTPMQIVAGALTGFGIGFLAIILFV
jgi:membrane-associated phospholipid phosphatase